MNPPPIVSVADFEDEEPPRRNRRESDKGAWLRLVALILATLALSLGSGTLWGMRDHEHRMTTVEVDTRDLKDADKQLRTEMKEMREDWLRRLERIENKQDELLKRR